MEKGDNDVAKSLEEVRNDSVIFNKEVFGDILWGKKKLEAHISNIIPFGTFRKATPIMKKCWLKRYCGGTKSQEKIG